MCTGVQVGRRRWAGLISEHASNRYPKAHARKIAHTRMNACIHISPRAYTFFVQKYSYTPRAAVRLQFSPLFHLMLPSFFLSRVWLQVEKRNTIYTKMHVITPCAAYTKLRRSIFSLTFRVLSEISKYNGCASANTTSVVWQHQSTPCLLLSSNDSSLELPSALWILSGPRNYDCWAALVPVVLRYRVFSTIKFPQSRDHRWWMHTTFW